MIGQMFGRWFGGSRGAAVFHSDQYLRHTARRLEHLASLAIPVASRSVLELGAGIGDHTGYFVDRGCSVLATDAREANLRVLRRRYPMCRTMQLDVAAPSPGLNEAFEVVYSYGLLYHLRSPEQAVARMASWCTGLLLLETCVSPAADGPGPVRENRWDHSQARDGSGCRPGRLWLHGILKAHFAHVYTTRTQPRHPQFPLDWSKAGDQELTRAVFVCSRSPLDLPSLSAEPRTVHEAQT